MSLATVASRALAGIDAPEVAVEVHLGPGLPSFTIVGLPDAEVREAKDRVRAALNHTQFEFPARRITVNLAPADLPKDSGRFDLPIAHRHPRRERTDRRRGARGARVRGRALADRRAAPGARRARDGAAGARRSARAFVLPEQNAPQAALAEGAHDAAGAHAARSRARTSAARRSCRASKRPRAAPVHAYPDFSEVKGQPQAKRALEVAAAGGHSVLMIGPPGTGKSMLAARFPGILPPMSEAEALEVAAIHSVSAAGFDAARWGERPFRSPHHTASGAAHGRRRRAAAARARSRSRTAACCSWTSCRSSTATCSRSLREPLESGSVSISRAARQAQFPARFQLVAAMNPCPCGYCGSPAGRCRCTPDRIARYRGRISGPLADRIDIKLEVPAPRDADLMTPGATESSEAIREQSACARIGASSSARACRTRCSARARSTGYCAHRQGRRSTAAPRARAPAALGARLPPRAARGAHDRRPGGRCHDRARRTSPKPSSTAGSTRVFEAAIVRRRRSAVDSAPMATYAIGDVQGCFDELQALLGRIGFNPRARPAVVRRRPGQPRARSRSRCCASCASWATGRWWCSATTTCTSSRSTKASRESARTTPSTTCSARRTRRSSSTGCARGR